MLSLGQTISPLKRPMGLAARAVLFVTGLLLATAAVATVTTWWGAERESERHQFSVAQDLTLRFAENVAAIIADGDGARLPSMVHRMALRDDVQRISLRALDNTIIAESGEEPGDVSIATRMSRRVNESGGVESFRAPNGDVVVGTPLVVNGTPTGAIVVMWAPNEFRFNALLALMPFFLVLGCLLLAAIPLATVFVRRAIAPLDELTRFAERVAEQGEAALLELKTGDEFETLANAFNHMMKRIDASMKRIQQIAFVDPVTQLPNQDRFLREVDYHVLHGKTAGEGGAVLVFEFQRLPKLLTTLDPEASRELMRLVAERFSVATRTVDKVIRLHAQTEKSALTARLASHDFAVYAPGVVSPAVAARFGQHLNAALNQPFDWRGHKLSLGSVCGVAIAPRDGKDADAVTRHARIALNAAAKAPAKMKVFTQSLDRETIARVNLEREMRGALERNEFRAFFQPKINLATGRIEAAEALARWVRADRTIISPARFIPLAEESGLIEPLSDAIMREAAWKAAAWARAGAPVKMAVNVSALQFRNDRFADHVLQIIQHAGLPASSLELEITESVVMEDPDRALRLIEKVRSAGVRLAIDDFGCGHSSLAALSKLPFDVIKIDQQFIRALERDDRQAEAIIDMILALANALNLEVVAEGVERPEQVEFMKARGCHWVQGFYYSAPVSPAEFAEMLRRQAGEEITAEDAA